MLVNNEIYCDICHLKIYHAEEMLIFGGTDRHYHDSCLKGGEKVLVKKRGRLFAITATKTEWPKIEPAPFEEEALTKKDPVQVACRHCGKPIYITKEKFVALRKEFSGNYKGFEILNYHPECLARSAEVNIYERSDTDRHWLIFINKTKTNIAKK